MKRMGEMFTSVQCFPPTTSVQIARAEIISRAVDKD